MKSAIVASDHEAVKVLYLTPYFVRSFVDEGIRRSTERTTYNYGVSAAFSPHEDDILIPETTAGCQHTNIQVKTNFRAILAVALYLPF